MKLPNLWEILAWYWKFLEKVGVLTHRRGHPSRLNGSATLGGVRARMGIIVETF